MSLRSSQLKLNPHISKEFDCEKRSIRNSLATGLCVYVGEVYFSCQMNEMIAIYLIPDTCTNGILFFIQRILTWKSITMKKPRLSNRKSQLKLWKTFWMFKLTEVIYNKSGWKVWSFFDKWDDIFRGCPSNFNNYNNI